MAGKTFGIRQGFFADFRNFSSSSSAAGMMTKSIAAVSSVSVTTDAGSKAPAATATSHIFEPSCPPHTSSKNALSGGNIAGMTRRREVETQGECRLPQKANIVRNHTGREEQIQSEGRVERILPVSCLQSSNKYRRAELQ